MTLPRIEPSLAASETRYRRLFESARDGILILDADTGLIVDVNPYLKELTGYSDEDFLGLHLWEIGPLRDVTTAMDSFAELQNEKYVRYDDLPLTARDGGLIDVEFVSNVYVADGENVIQCNIRDIRGRKQAEAAHARLQEQLRVSQRTQAIGTLAGGIAHDFATMLTSMAAYIGLVRDQLTGHALPPDDIDGLERVRLRAAGLTQQLLALARRQILRPVPCRLNDVVTGFVSMAERILPRSISFEVDLDPALSAVLADTVQMDQVLLNLAINAGDAMPEGGVLTIATRALAPTDGAAFGDVSLTVSDTGVGIPADQLARIFEPFMTTKPAGKGTGLGLSVVQGIVAQHEGTIEVTSEPGRGARFTITLPGIEPPPAEAECPLPPLPYAAKGRETVLLAEDDDDLRALAERIMRSAGYRVLSARDGEQALTLFREHADALTLVVFDMIMPRMGGYEALVAIRASAPLLPALLISGYSEELLDGLPDTPVAFTFLAKPFTRPDLLTAIRETIDR